jgi:prepilin peptidase CpaA
METYLLAGALAVAVVGAGWDVVTYRIPNALTYTAMLVGVLSHVLLERWVGLYRGPAGLLLGGGIFLVLYLLRTMGAGDVKLMAAVGAFAGPSRIIEIALYSAIAGGIFALVVAIYKGRLRRTFRNLIDLLQFHSAVGAEVHPTLNLENPEALRFAYGVAIFAGTLVEFVNYVR